MSSVNRDRVLGLMAEEVNWPDDPVVELSLMVPGSQAAELERLAHSRGLTVGQLIRQLIRDCLTGRRGSEPGS